MAIVTDMIEVPALTPIASRYRGAVDSGYRNGPYMLEQFDIVPISASAAALFAGGRGRQFASHVVPMINAVYTPGNMIIIEKYLAAVLSVTIEMMKPRMEKSVGTVKWR